MSGAIKDKNARRRALKKAKKAESASTPASTPAPESREASVAAPVAEAPAASKPEPDADGDASLLISLDGPDLDDPMFEQYKSVLERFQQSDKEDPSHKEVVKPEVLYDDDDIPDEEEETEHKMSKKEKKQQNKLSIAELKALVKKPDLVDWTDTSAPDPRLLVAIKASRNVVPVPNHWSLKREYLSSKRGVEKAPFALPGFIQETGIAEMRDAALEKQDQQSLKQKQRERVSGKTGKLDIDYSKLYDAFFKFQTKPELTRYGEVYYEGKEYETNLRHLRPGELSEELKDALNIPPGAPPPWLINQQRFGPPPSYPALKIPGLNAPPPVGAAWGFHPGGYGKPPVDENNRPLYGGDIYGVATAPPAPPAGEPVEKTLWGELQPAEEESEEEEESDEEEEEGDEEDIGAGLQTPGGLETPSGVASAMPSEYGGTESVSGEFELRKQRPRGEEEAPKSAYTVLPEQNIRAQGFFGGERAYDLAAANKNLPVLGQEDNRRKRKAGDVDVSVDVDALEEDEGLTKEEVKKRYEDQRQQEQQGMWGGRVDQDDLSAMIAAESRKRQKKDQERRDRR